MKTKYETVVELTEQGKTCKEIARITGISLPSIYKYRGTYHRTSKPTTNKFEKAITKTERFAGIVSTEQEILV